MKKIIVLFLFVLIYTATFAQNPVYIIGQQAIVTDCAGDFFDSGNAGAPYGANQNLVITFNSSNTPNTHIKMTFNSFDVDPGDTLIVYDGATTAAPIIGKYNNNNLPPNFVDASIYNASGDLTFRFKSNGTLNNSGWFGSLVCIPQCQDIFADFHPTLTVPHPNDSNYIDICIGNPITFAANGAAAFIQNNVLYQQDSSTSTYLWDFGDGTTATGQIVTHTYTLVKGYDVGLTITDTRGCTNSNYLGGRVRVSDNPITYIHPVPDMCSSQDTSVINIGYNGNSVIVVSPILSHQSSSQRYDSITFIPDGPNCPPGVYNTYVTFTQFLPGQTITSANDILSICVDIEHSFAGDLGFSIICPNGQQVILDGNDHSGGSYLGQANDVDGTPTCSPAANLPGTPWVYCWSQLYPQQGSMNVLDAGASPIPATDTLVHNNYLTPDASLSGLIGCPLNGTWNIQITDNWGIDNGYVFWWSLNLDPALLPGGWSYEVPIDTVIWTGSNIHYLTDSSIYITPASSGTFPYTVTVIDEFGCSYDTTLSVSVIATPDVDLGNDTILCGQNLVYTIDAGPGSTYNWNTGNPNQTQVVTNTGYYSVEVTNQNANGTLSCKGSDTIFIKVLQLPSQVELGPDLCVTEPVDLDAGNPGFVYEWSTSATTQTITASTTGMYYVSVSEEFGYNCEKVDSVHVTLIPSPTISIGPDTAMCSHGKIYMRIKDADNYLEQYPYTYLWTTDPVSAINGATTRDVNLSCLEIGKTYTITATVTGCDVKTGIRNIESLQCDISLPNVITPNADGHNDVFEITGIENFPGSNMKIYNRWGKKVYESDNYNDASNYWDGGGEAEGVYYFVLTISFGDHGDCISVENQSGTVTILR